MAEKKSKKIGILGGSFNPAHEGHLYISKEAIKRLGLDEVWWLVSKQNPLKSEDIMDDFASRIKKAEKMTENEDKIKVSDFELKVKSNYSFDVISALLKSYKKHDFIWMMGADNLIQFSKWYKWREIFGLIPVAVLNREVEKNDPLESEAAKVFKDYKLKDSEYYSLAGSFPPVWAFVDIDTHSASSTKIRKKQLENKEKTPYN